MSGTPAQRVSRHVTINANGCWLANRLGDRLARVRLVDGGPKLSVRRAAWEAVRGPLPDDRWPAPACGRSDCVAPAHAELVDRAQVHTVRDNSALHSPMRRIRIARAMRARSGMTAEVVAHIRHMRAMSAPLSMIATDLRASYDTVEAIARMRRWVPEHALRSGLI